MLFIWFLGLLHIAGVGVRRTTAGRERAIQRLVQKPDGAWYSRRALLHHG